MTLPAGVRQGQGSVFVGLHACPAQPPLPPCTASWYGKHADKAQGAAAAVTGNSKREQPQGHCQDTLIL